MRSGWRVLVVWSCFAVLEAASTPVFAIPSFERQTGLQCAACHTVFPDLTAFGRQFKLRGYTMGSQLANKPFPYEIPLALGMQVGNTSVKDRNNGADASADFPSAGKTIVQQAAFYYGGRVFGDLGAMAQYNWDGVERKWGAEMVDIRYARATTVKDRSLVYGISLANSPTVQDVWNTSPMWSFPHLQDAGIMPMVTSLFDMTLDNQVGAVEVYADFDGQYYGEIGFLRNGHTGIFRPLNSGKDLQTAIDGTAPHIRIAWERDRGARSFEIGVHALRAEIFPDPQNLNGPTDRYTDVALDGQYQYAAGAHLFSIHGFFDHEKRDWNASFPMGMASNTADKLSTLKASVHYWYQRRLGGGVGFADYGGDSDQLKYGMTGMPSAMGSVSGSPDTRSWTIEGDWLPLQNRQNLKLGVRYTAYTKFNGARNNYNGFGRNASDNDALFVYAWLLY